MKSKSLHHTIVCFGTELEANFQEFIQETILLAALLENNDWNVVLIVSWKFDFMAEIYVWVYKSWRVLCVLAEKYSNLPDIVNGN